MSILTPFLNLFKWDKTTDPTQKFNIDLALNENWDKLDTSLSNLYNASQAIAGEKTFSDGIGSAKGGIFYGKRSPFPTGKGTYIANYVDDTYGARILAYDGVAYKPMYIGAMPTSGKFSQELLSNGDTKLNYNLNVLGNLNNITPTEIGYLSGISSNIQSQLNLGWISLLATLTYSSTDTPTFIATTSIDLTGIISVGMKLKLTQTTTKYFIVTAISNNTITLYGGTDYTLANATISNVYYSLQKAPYGFPLDPDKWTEILKNNSETGKISPSANTWYNVLSKSIPIGAWKLSYGGVVYGYDANENVFDEYTTLSTSSSSESDIDFTLRLFMSVSTSSATSFSATASREKNVIFLAKTTVYLNLKTGRTTQEDIAMRGDWGTTTIKAVCAYL